MGIPSYFSHIIRNYKGIIKLLTPELRSSESQQSYMHLFMDSNSIIYDCVHSMESPTNSTIIDNVIVKIDEYIKKINPSNTIYIAFDGVAPFAKMKQQRNRRYKTNYINKILGKTDKWNTNNITPGTEFMDELSRRITRELKPKNYRAKHFYISTPNEVGEGEHKIFDYIRKNPCINDDVYIYGLDSDLFMLSIFNCQYYRNCFIFREAPEFIRELLEKEPSKNDMYLIDTNMLQMGILAQMGYHKSSTLPHHEQERAIIYDYVFICFFLGNDFLPMFPSLNIRTKGIERIMRTYRKIHKQGQYMIKNDGINWPMVRLFINELAKNEEEYMREEQKSRNKFDNWTFTTPKTMEEKEKYILNLPIMKRETEKYVNPFEEGWQERYRRINGNVYMESTQNNAYEYLLGLEWVYKYYKGEERNQWNYNGYLAPLLVDLSKSMQNFDFLKEKRPKEKYETKEFQLNYVMPQDIEKTGVNDNLHKLKWAYKRYIWEADITST